MSEDFDYGERLSDGQFERHPTDESGGRVAPFRSTYVHDRCNRGTNLGGKIARTYASNPKYYTHTFCSACGDYFPVSEFRWSVDGKRVGEM